MRYDFSDVVNLDTPIITLIGMSGVGKTYLSNILSDGGRHVYSVDEMIGLELSAYLDAPIDSKNDISALSYFLGTIDDFKRDPVTFRQRQELYKVAEIKTLKAIWDEVSKKTEPCVIDTSGSFCELMEEEIIHQIGSDSAIVYLQANSAIKDVLLMRAYDHPKPLYFPPSFLEDTLKEYEKVDKDEPLFDYVFRNLFQSRLAKYQSLVEKYDGIVCVPPMPGQ